MIYLSSHDKFVQISLINLISQINPNLVSSIKNLSFVHIEVQQVNEQLHFIYNQQKEVIKTPIKINNMFDCIYNLIFEKTVSINKFDFYPFKQIISYKNNEVKLNFISNEILRNLYLYKEHGIDKNTLYCSIWPNFHFNLDQKLNVIF